MNWELDPSRGEWICEHGVGHYDANLVKHTIHGCDGCCGHDDFPGRTLESTKAELEKRGYKLKEHKND